MTVEIHTVKFVHASDVLTPKQLADINWVTFGDADHTLVNIPTVMDRIDNPQLRFQLSHLMNALGVGYISFPG